MGPTRVKFDESDDEPEQAPMRGGHDSGSNSGGSDGEASSSGRSDSDSEGEHELEQKLSNIPLEVLERLKADGRGPVGAAARAAAAAAKQQTRQGTFKREHKYRPQEVSSKRPVGRFREVIQVPKG
jgi:ribosomal RNA-processing protein 36